jgi:hypothetical protein
METEKKLDVMEEELRLMKGEVKQSLASVRDYLLNMELPSSEFATVLAALGSDGEQKITMKGSFSNNDRPPEGEKPAYGETEEPVTEEIREEDDFAPEDEMPPEGEDQFEDGESFSEASEPFSEDFGEEEPEALPAEDEEYSETESAPQAGEDHEEATAPYMNEAGPLPEEAAEMMPGIVGAEASQSPPKVNLLANLMHWVTKTKKEIGMEQMAIFLEVYGISGHLSPDLKELILHMADIASDKTEDGSTAETWSRAMLSLHGILTGGDAPLHPVKSFWHEEVSETPTEEENTAETEPEEPEEAPYKLKLVLPGSNGTSQEFCLDLKPELASNGAKAAPEKRQPQQDGGEVIWQTRKRKK